MTARFSLLLGTDRHQRLRITRMLTAVGVYAFCMLLQWQAVWQRHTAVGPALWLSAAVVLGQLILYAMLRSGHNLRYAEPALTMPQTIFSLLTLAAAYRINPHVRGALLELAALVLVFGAFTLPPRRCRQLGWVATALMALAMAHGASHAPWRFDPQIELVHFLFTLAVLPTLAFLAGELSQLRIDHQAQRRELRTAMQRLRQQAMHDELTGLPNRRHVHDWTARELARNHRNNASLCVAIIDLDHFKRINDLHGHEVGDTVLRVFAREARPLLRASDMLARWGGEEFMLVMPESTLAEAQQVLERLRAHMAQPSTWVEVPHGQVSFSAGLTEQAFRQALADTIRQADAALYEAKRRGRDRVVSV